MFMLRSTCLCVLCHVLAQIYMLVLRSMSICLDLCVYVLHAMLVCSDLCWLLCHVLLQHFLALNISLSCFLALSVRCRSRSRGIGLHPYTQAYIKGFGSFPLHVYICLLASMLYLHVSLSRYRLCHAWCPLWACACVVASVPLRVCLNVNTCEIHHRGVCVLDSHLSLPCAMLICLSCLLRATYLAFFASMLSLHACLHVHA